MTKEHRELMNNLLDTALANRKDIHIKRTQTTSRHNVILDVYIDEGKKEKTWFMRAKTVKDDETYDIVITDLREASTVSVSYVTNIFTSLVLDMTRIIHVKTEEERVDE